MWMPQTPKYQGQDQPGPCETQTDHFVRWMMSLVGALFPSTPHYDTTPSDPAGSGDAPASSGNGGSVDPKQAALAHLFRMLFNPTSK